MAWISNILERRGICNFEPISKTSPISPNLLQGDQSLQGLDLENQHSAWVHCLKFSPGLEFWKNAAQCLESFRSALRFSFFCFQLIQQQDEQSGRHVSQILRLAFDLSCTIHMLESTELELVHSRAPGFTEPLRGGKV